MMSPDEAKKYYLSGEYRNEDGTNNKFPNIEQFYNHQKEKVN